MEEEVKEQKQETQTQEPETKEEQEQEIEISKPLEKMTAKELREIAMKIPGVEGVHAMKKEKLIEVIKEAKGIKEEKVISGKDTIKELKAKISMLKKEKEEARLAKDKRKVEILRRRINRLKKQTRKIAQG